MPIGVQLSCGWAGGFGAPSKRTALLSNSFQYYFDWIRLWDTELLALIAEYWQRLD